MQGSCNVTGMGRILEPLREKFGNELVRFDVTLVRRWADIEQTEKNVSDTIEMTEKPHHGDDVKLYFGCLLYTSPSPRDYAASRMPSSA